MSINADLCSTRWIFNKKNQIEQINKKEEYIFLDCKKL